MSADSASTAYASTVATARVRPVRRTAGSNRGRMAGFPGAPRTGLLTSAADLRRMGLRAEYVSANDPHATALENKYQLLTVGDGLRPSAALDHEALGLTEEQARLIERAQEAVWKRWDEREAHASGRTSFLGLQKLAMCGMFKHGEGLFVVRMLDEAARTCKGRSLSVCLLDVHPGRLETPPLMSSNERMRDGVEVDEDGEPVAFWICNPEQTDLNSYARIPAMSGRRPQVLHFFGSSG